MEKNKRNKIIIFALILALSSVFIFTYINYKNREDISSEVSRRIDLNNDNRKENITFQNNKLVIDDYKGKTVYSEKVNDKNTENKIGFIKDSKSGDTKIIAAKKTNDTSRILTLESYTYVNGKLDEKTIADNIYQGKAEIQDNKLLIHSPVFKKSDCNAEPSSEKITTYSLNNNELIELNSEEKEYKATDKLFTSGYHSNPSKDEINKILGYVANEKGIPPEILKGIAFQESSLRQFNSSGQPLIGYDGIGIGIMQVSDYDKNDTAYVNKLKYDIEFNIRQGAEILLKKWQLQDSSPRYKIPKVGSGSPMFREHWYYAIWAYNGYSQINNPALHHDTAYQTRIIDHVRNIYGKSMTDLYVYNPGLFSSSSLPRSDIAEISSKNAADITYKQNGKTFVADDILAIRDSNMNSTGSYYYSKDIVKIEKEPVVSGGYIMYYVSGCGKSGWVKGNWLKLLGDDNYDNVVDIYDCVNISKHINTSDTSEIDKYDINQDGKVDSADVKAAAQSGNWN